MAYKLKPNYHFANTDSVGIDKVPVGRLIVVEDYGNQHEIKWLRKVSNGGLDETTTINDAITLNALNSPFDEKRDFSDSYSVTEVQSMLTLKRNIEDSYDKTEVELALSLKRDIEDSYDRIEMDAVLAEKQSAFVPTPTTSIGAIGDIIGQIAISSDYIYYCTATYTDGLSDIWARTPLTLETW